MRGWDGVGSEPESGSVPQPIVADMGGIDAITKVVHRFYEKVYADPTLAPIFQNVNRERQEQRLVAFIAMVDTHSWMTAFHRSFLRTAHAHVPITDQTIAVRRDLWREAAVEEGHPASVVDVYVRFNDTWAKFVRPL
jgi:hypothetical protein